MTTVHVPAQLRAVIDDVCKYFVSRDELAMLTGIAIIAREHLLIHGPTGCAKTDVCQEVHKRITGAKHFKVQGTEEMPYTDITGPVDFPKLLNNGVEEFNIEGYAYDCHYAIFDEYGRFAGGTLNKALGLINKDLVKNGVHVLDIPLLSVFATTNTRLTGTHAANANRFALQTRVKYLETEQELEALDDVDIDHPVRRISQQVSLAEIERMSAMIPLVKVNTRSAAPEVFAKKRAIVRRLRGEGIQISDRIIKKANTIIAAHAIYEGRDCCTSDDLFILTYVFGDAAEENEIPVRQAILEIANPVKIQILSRLDEATTMHREYFAQKEKVQTAEEKEKVAHKAAEVTDKLGQILTEMHEIVQSNPHNAQAVGAQVKIEKLQEDIVRRGLMSRGFKF